MGRYDLGSKQEKMSFVEGVDSYIPYAGSLKENLNVTKPPKTMEVHVFPGKSNIYNLYEDDGVSSLYEEGYFIVTRFDYNYLENNYNLIIRPFEGKSKIIPDTRNYRIRFRNTREPKDVDVLQDNTSIKFLKIEDVSILYKIMILLLKLMM